MNHRERIRAVFRGELVDVIPWVPRIDLWHNAQALAGTLPKKYEGMTVEQIHRTEGWPLHKFVPEYLKPEKPEDIYHRGIGLYDLKEYPHTFEFPSDVEIEVDLEFSEDEEMTHVVYHTPVGSVSVRHGLTVEMRTSGASISWVKEHAIKGPEDYKVLAHIFGNLKLKPAYQRYHTWRESIGDDGLAVAHGLGIACTSPIHFIQKTLLGATDFYMHYNDYAMEMGALAEALESPYNQLLDILADSGVDVVLWSANVDDMITYPALYEEHFQPWCHKAADKLSPQGIFLAIHPDGENTGLLDLIAESRMDIADAVTPYPMTKVKIEEFYDRWSRPGHLTIHGGIPEMLLLEKSSTRDDLKDYLDHLFKVIGPGHHFVASIGDTTPPAADFDRLIYIGERIEKEGRLPLAAGAYRPVTVESLAGVRQAAAAAIAEPVHARAEDDPYTEVLKDVLDGKHKKTVSDAKNLLDQGLNAKDILNKGMLPAMEIIGAKFADGTVFIPEVLLSARAMNEALRVLEPHLASSERDSAGKILIGTVRGDLHDIGKNMVLTMLKGVGYEVVDLGVNVKVGDFVRQVGEEKPDVLGLSALLTTTMPQIKDVIDALTEAGQRNEVKVVIGGAPINQKFADDVGADGYAPDAGAAVDLVKRIISAPVSAR
jgi:corrinoid protein of di/trimethylamine methyltransferase